MIFDLMVIKWHDVFDYDKLGDDSGDWFFWVLFFCLGRDSWSFDLALFVLLEGWFSFLSFILFNCIYAGSLRCFLL